MCDEREGTPSRSRSDHRPLPLPLLSHANLRLLPNYITKATPVRSFFIWRQDILCASANVVHRQYSSWPFSTSENCKEFSASQASGHLSHYSISLLYRNLPNAVYCSPCSRYIRCHRANGFCTRSHVPKMLFSSAACPPWLSLSLSLIPAAAQRHAGMPSVSQTTVTGVSGPIGQNATPLPNITNPYVKQARPNGLNTEKPNMILFMPDQLRYDAVGAFGSKVAKTPNLDAFALESTRFTNVFVQASTCSQSRCSMFTGQYPHVYVCTSN